MTTRHLSLGNDRLFYVALSLALVPIWLIGYLPGVDLPGHAAQAAALHEIWRGNELFTGKFEVNLLTPYLTATTLAALLAYVVPVNVAVKLLFSAAVLTIPLLAGKLYSAAGGDSRWRWLVIPSTYSFAYFWGFFPYVIAIPLGLGLLLLAVRFDKQPTLGMGLAIAAYSILLLVSHLLVLGFAALLALTWLAARNRTRPLRLARLIVPFAAPLPLIVAWVSTSLASGTYVSQQRMVFGPMLDRLRYLVVQPSGLDGNLFAISLLITGIIIAVPILSRARLTSDPAKWAVALTGLAVFMVFPRYAMGTAVIYERYGAFLPILWLLLWERNESEDLRWHPVAMAMVPIWLITSLWQLATFSADTRHFDRMLEAIEPGKRVASMPVVNRDLRLAYPVYLHFPSWYQADSRGVVNFNFGQFYGTMVVYRDGHEPPYDSEMAWVPFEFDWQRNAGDTYDYFIVHANVDVGLQIFKEYRSSVELVAQEGWWWLYRGIGTPQ